MDANATSIGLSAEGQKLVENYILGKLRTIEMIPAEASSETTVEIWESCANEFEDAVVREDFSTAVEKIQRFEQWLTETNWHYVSIPKYTVTLVTVEVTMPARGGTVSVSMSANVQPGYEGRAIKEMHAKIVEEVTANFKAQDKANGSQTPAPNTKGENKQSPAANEETFKFSYIRVETFKGNQVVRVIPDKGRWTQFGVPLKNKTLIQSLEDQNLIDRNENNDYRVSGMVTYRLNAHGTPAEVLTIKLYDKEEEE